MNQAGAIVRQDRNEVRIWGLDNFLYTRTSDEDCKVKNWSNAAQRYFLKIKALDVKRFESAWKRISHKT